MNDKKETNYIVRNLDRSNEQNNTLKINNNT